MRTLAIVLFLSTQLWAQDDLPISIGTGEFPPKVDVSTDIHELRELEIEAFTLGVDLLKKRYEVGQLQVSFVLDPLSRLTDLRLQIATSKQERLDVIQDSFVTALTIWQRVRALQKAGVRGGEGTVEAQTRAATFRYRIMWLEELIEDAEEGNSAPNSEMLRLPEDLTKGEIPPGVDSINLGEVSDLHVQVLQLQNELVRNRYERGLASISEYLDTKQALNEACLKMTTAKQARLDLIQESFVNAVLAWQRVREMQKIGQFGGTVENEAKARAVVLDYRARWLEEKLDSINEKDKASQLAVYSEGIPEQVGTGEFPPGLETANDVESINKLQLDAYEVLLETARNNREKGLINATFTHNVQTEVALARLKFAQDPQQRLAYIEEAFIGALQSWQLTVQLVESTAIHADHEVIPRAMVYHFRIMWLLEKEKQTNQSKASASKENDTTSNDQLDTHDPSSAYTTSSICISDGSVVRNFRLRANQSDQRPLLMRRWIHRCGR